MDRVDAVVVGAGAVGLACAARLAASGLQTIVLEESSSIGTGNSSRNSEVIHAGLYYPTGSLKHRLCIEGRHALYKHLDRHGLPYRRCGKLVVATSDAEGEAIAALAGRARANDVEEISLIDRTTARGLEPELECVVALHSEQTGIFDSHAYMLSLQGLLEDHGGAVAFETRFVRAEVLPAGGFLIETECGEPYSFISDALIICAGLHAQALGARIEGYDPGHIPPLHLAKGSYYQCRHRPVFSRLIYPAPVDGGLGVHLTLDMAGQMRFGPDVEWLPGTRPEGIDYQVDPARADGFYQAVRRYWPGLPDGSLVPDYAGCRPKLAGPGGAQDPKLGDFMLQGPDDHGVPGLLMQYGIESPGLTASLAIARMSAGLLELE